MIYHTEAEMHRRLYEQASGRAAASFIQGLPAHDSTMQAILRDQSVVCLIMEKVMVDCGHFPVLCDVIFNRHGFYIVGCEKRWLMVAFPDWKQARAATLEAVAWMNKIVRKTDNLLTSVQAGR